ncbi:MAG: hypothetical protein JRI23_01605 [Deltaproteobacteria bacterium]|jgi:hypothetical protein|nr:hypothetical protein [Deltaproteobacteria bacterium]MBW2530162.1 hypothetical protein [Deltaproteobacteria bacterium]
MGRWAWLVVLSGVVALAPSISCSDDSSTAGGGASGTGAAAGTGGTGATGTASGTGGDLGFGGSSMGGGTGQGGGATCAGESSSAQPVPLDMYIMLDRSGSMNEETGVAGVTKWDAVTTGLSAFFADSESAGLGVALQFFPLNKPGVPDTCTAHAQCGSSGPCFISVCQLQWSLLGNIVPCAGNADCGAFGPCVDLGQCQNDSSYVCQPVGGSCGGGLGDCVDMVQSYCIDGLSCDAAHYASPAVPMGTLPGHASALDTEIGGQSPTGGTPTSSALQGTVDFALAHKQQNQLHEVVAVLATDGIPTLCDPTDAGAIAQIASDAFNGTPSVPTFVIGVISPSEPGAQATLDQIAAAGGTTSAFIVDPNGNVTQAFVDALDQIRGNSLACEYFIPQPTPPDTIDYGLVNVDHTPPGATDANTVPYVGDEGSCHPNDGGWYYDTDPAVDEPAKILMCPATCDLLQAGGDLSIRVGCETVVPR